MRIAIIIFLFIGVLSGCQTSETIPGDYNRLQDEIIKVKPHLSSGEFEKAEEQLNGLLEETKEKGYHYLSAKIYTYLGFIFDEKQLLKKGFVTYNQALKYWNKTDTPSYRNIFVCLNNLGLICDSHKEYEQAEFYYSKALEMKDKLSANELADLYYNMGSSYKGENSTGDLDKAEACFLKALEIAKKNDDHRRIASTYYIIGLMYSDIEDYDVANISFNEAISYSKKHNIDEFIECSLHALGHNSFLNDDYGRAIQYLNEAKEFNIDNNVVFEIYRDLGKTYKKMGDRLQAIETWENAIAISDPYFESKKADIYREISNTYQEIGNLEKALAYSNRYNQRLGEVIASKSFTKRDYDKILFKDVVSNYEEFQHKETFQYKLRYTYVPAGVAILLIFLAVFLIYRYQLSYKKKLRAEKIRSFQVD